MSIKNRKLKCHINSFIYGKLSFQYQHILLLKKDLFFGLDKNIQFNNSAKHFPTVIMSNFLL